MPGRIRGSHGPAVLWSLSPGTGPILAGDTLVLKFVDTTADTWGMTRTALRALTVAALSAAVLLTGTQTALAAPLPTCAPGEEFQGEFGCVAVQLPEERLGRQFDREDGALCEITAVNPDEVECIAPVHEVAQPSASAAATTTLAQQAPPAPSGATAPVDTAPVSASAQAEVPATLAPSAASAPASVSLEPVLEWLRDMLPWLFVPLPQR